MAPVLTVHRVGHKGFKEGKPQECSDCIHSNSDRHLGDILMKLDNSLTSASESQMGLDYLLDSCKHRFSE